MMRLLIALTLVAAASAGDSSRTVAAGSFDAGTYCSDCAPVANKHADATLTCKTGSATEGTVRLVGSPKCAAGFFFTAGSGTGHDTCVACEANCNACTSATACTAPKAGFLDGADPVACTPVNVSVCTAHATSKVVRDAATLCPADNTFTAQADAVAGSGSKPAGCTTCAANQSPNAADTAGCVDCAAISNAATGATRTCAATGGETIGATGTVVLVAASSGDHSGRKCAPGFFYEANVTTDGSEANAKCTACETNCYTCSDATTCTRPNAGYFITGGNPTACTALSNADLCTAHATLKVKVTDTATLCPANNQFTAQVDDAAGASTKGAGCEACAANSSPNAQSTAGCANCAAIDNAATGATRTCAATGGETIGAAGTVVLVAATGTWGTTDVTTAAPHPGRKCAPGFFYENNVTTDGSEANAKCTACETGCITCTTATNCSAEGAASGYFVTGADAAPAACTARTAEQCAAVADSDKFPSTVGATNSITGVCYINAKGKNPATAQVTDSTGCSYEAKACPTPAPSTDSAGTSAPSMFAVLVAAAVALRM